MTQAFEKPLYIAKRKLGIVLDISLPQVQEITKGMTIGQVDALFESASAGEVTARTSLSPCSTVKQIAQYMYTHDHELGFCGHDIGEDAMVAIIGTVAELLGYNKHSFT